MKEEGQPSVHVRGRIPQRRGQEDWGLEWLKQKRVRELEWECVGYIVELGTRLAERCKVPWRGVWDTPRSSGPSAMRAANAHPRSLSTTAVPGPLLNRNLVENVGSAQSFLDHPSPEQSHSGP